MWANEHLSKDEAQFQRLLRNQEIESIETLFTSVQNHIQDLQDEEFSSLTDQLEWYDAHGKHILW